MKKEKAKMIFKTIIEMVFYLSCILMFAFTLVNAMETQTAYTWLMFSLVVIMILHQIKDDLTLIKCDKEKEKCYNEIGKKQSLQKKPNYKKQTR